MKKLFIAILGLFAATSAMALDNEPEVGLTWQAQVGMNIANIRNSKMNAKVGANLGFYGQYMLQNAHGTYVNFGLNYGMKGARDSYESLDLNLNLKKVTDAITLHYVNVPIHVGFQYNVIPEVGVFADFGPYFGVGLGGRKTVTKNNHSDPPYKVFKGENGQSRMYDRFDWGLGFRVGGEYNQHYSLTFGFDWGISDMINNYWHAAAPDEKFNYLNSEKFKNFSTSITLGYRF